MTGDWAFWRRLDSPGHEACRLRQHPNGWRLSGTAIFRQDRVPVSLSYVVSGDATWASDLGEVSGWIGEKAVDFAVIRSAEGQWIMNGTSVPGLDGLIDLDLGFTPSTNLPQVRRINLSVGQSAEVPVAWLDVFAGTLTELPQRYERRSETTYWYESPTAPYSGLLEVNAAGFITRYPGLWSAEP